MSEQENYGDIVSHGLSNPPEDIGQALKTITIETDKITYQILKSRGIVQKDGTILPDDFKMLWGLIDWNRFKDEMED